MRARSGWTLAAIGVNFVDTYHRSGYYPVTLPFVPGVEGAGTVAAVGPGVHRRTGGRPGGVSRPEGRVRRLRPSLRRTAWSPYRTASTTRQRRRCCCRALTAHYLLLDSYPVRPGDVVLVHAAAGGMGLLLTQIATKLGATVIGTVSTVDKEKLARQAGAAEVIRYTEQDVTSEVRRITGGAGVPAVYDGVGRDTFDASLASLRRRGTLVLYGAASGPVPPFDPQRLQHAGSVFLTRPTLGHHIAQRAELEAPGAGRVRLGRRRPHGPDPRPLSARGGRPGPHGSAEPADHRKASARALILNSPDRRVTGPLSRRAGGQPASTACAR